MSRNTLKQIIVKRLEEVNDWIPGYDLEKVNTRFGWLGTSSTRRCRELFNEGKILRKISGKYVYYKSLEVKYETYRVQGMPDQQVKLRIN